MRATFVVAVVLGTGLLICCTPRVRSGAPTLPVTAQGGEEIRISRGPCFGFCPVYTLAVTPAGRVDFKGERHTAVLGQRAHSVGRTAYEDVRGALAALRPETGIETEFACKVAVSDMSHLTLEWIAADGTRTALTYGMGCRDPEGAAIMQTVEKQLHKLEAAEWAAQKTWPGDTRG
ncbi:hypothetical protein V474_11370 [Novosphingobium barchaimii LL02]|uniref:DUF6438 domain-containing protein n=1 Tax=Novosphingobium barchaimii LL02 TaxID=1114963 RepID=A0A0J7Y7I1_9SPHN|nr:DUF6438 domain-containing protein [Novosphingobium barchaimii]KMS59786.1 hypothetical protein V474_11370 [Novosphingobium barchaimii LL02]